MHAAEVEPAPSRAGGAALVISAWPSRYLAKMRSQAAIALVLVHAVEAEPRQVSSEHSTMKVERVGVEAVGVRPDPAVLGLLEGEGEGVANVLLRAEPDELVGAHVDVGLERRRRSASRTLRVDAVGGDDQVVVAPYRLGAIASRSRSAARRRARARGPAGCSSSRLRPMPLKPWPPTSVIVSPRIVDVDVVPVGELVGDDRCGAVGVVGAAGCRASGRRRRRPSRRCRRARLRSNTVDLVRGVAQLHRDGEIEPGRPAAEAGDAHGRASIIAAGCERACSRPVDISSMKFHS